MKKVKLGIIGLGNMGFAIAEGAIKQNVYAASEVGYYQRSEKNTEKANHLGMHYFSNEVECAENCEILMLAIKPQGFNELFEKIRHIKNKPLLLSIAAGININSIQHVFPNSKVVRTMPNTPLMIGLGATALCRSKEVSDSEYQQIQGLFNSIGKTCLIDESLMDAIIPVSGSTPAYVYYFIDLLAKDAVNHGFEYNDALQMVIQTFIGASTLLQTDGRTPEELITMVCSKGGATIEAMNILKDGRLEQVFKEANAAAIKRSIELGQ